MRRTARATILCLIVALAAAATTASAATRGFKASCHTGKSKIANGTITQRGPFTSSFGKGTIVMVSTGDNERFQTKATLKFSGGGSLKLAGKSRTGGAADPGKYSLRATWKIVGGTGKYRGATGSVKVIGLGFNDLHAADLTLTGKVSR